MTGGLWELNVGQIYSTLERLTREGLVMLAESEEGAGDDRKVYTITQTGIAELDAWLAAPPPRPKPLRDDIYVRLGLLMERNPEAALRAIEAQQGVSHVRMAELTRQKVGLVRIQAADRWRRELLLDAALLQVEADLKWLEICVEKLRARLG